MSCDGNELMKFNGKDDMGSRWFDLRKIGLTLSSLA